MTVIRHDYSYTDRFADVPSVETPAVVDDNCERFYYDRVEVPASPLRSVSNNRFHHLAAEDRPSKIGRLFQCQSFLGHSAHSCSPGVS
jgi:hypothetical protein